METLLRRAAGQDKAGEVIGLALMLWQGGLRAWGYILGCNGPTRGELP